MPVLLKKTATTITKARVKKVAKKRKIKGTPIADVFKAVEEAQKKGLDLTYLSK